MRNKHITFEPSPEWSYCTSSGTQELHELSKRQYNAKSISVDTLEKLLAHGVAVEAILDIEEAIDESINGRVTHCKGSEIFLVTMCNFDSL